MTIDPGIRRDEVTDALQRSIEASADEDRRRVLDKVWPCYMARQRKSAATKEDESLAPAIKQWLELNADEVLVDTERGVRAWLQRSGSGVVWDLRPLTEVEVLHLWREGLLTIQTKAFDALRSAAPSTVLDTIHKTRGVRNEGESWSLQVKPIDK